MGIGDPLDPPQPLIDEALQAVVDARRKLDAASVAYGLALAEEHEAQKALPVGKTAQEAVIAAVKAYNAAWRVVRELEAGMEAE